jgi:hypothetical protein
MEVGGAPTARGSRSSPTRPCYRPTSLPIAKQCEGVNRPLGLAKWAAGGHPPFGAIGATRPWTLATASMTTASGCAGDVWPSTHGEDLLSCASIGSAETACVKACVTPALPRRRSRYPSASGQVLRKPRGRKPRRTPRWSLSAAAMAIDWRWGCDPAARGASSRPRQRTRFACDAPLRRGGERQRSVQARSPRNARSDPLNAMVGVELVDGDRASS